MSRGRHLSPGSMALTPDQLALFEAIMPRVKREAHRLAYVLKTDPDEALSACLIVSARVVGRFDPTRGLSIYTMLWPALFRAVQRLKREDRTIHIPGHYFDDDIGPAYRAKAEIALTVRPLVDENGKALPIVDPSAPDPEADAIRTEEMDRLHFLLSFLSWRERIILWARARDVRLRTLGDCFGISGSRINQIEFEAREKIRRRAARLRDL